MAFKWPRSNLFNLALTGFMAWEGVALWKKVNEYEDATNALAVQKEKTATMLKVRFDYYTGDDAPLLCEMTDNILHYAEYSVALGRDHAPIAVARDSAELEQEDGWKKSITAPWQREYGMDLIDIPQILDRAEKEGADEIHVYGVDMRDCTCEKEKPGDVMVVDVSALRETYINFKAQRRVLGLEPEMRYSMARKLDTSGMLHTEYHPVYPNGRERNVIIEASDFLRTRSDIAFTTGHEVGHAYVHDHRNTAAMTSHDQEFAADSIGLSFFKNKSDALMEFTLSLSRYMPHSLVADEAHVVNTELLLKQIKDSHERSKEDPKFQTHPAAAYRYARLRDLAGLTGDDIAKKYALSSTSWQKESCACDHGDMTLIP